MYMPLSQAITLGGLQGLAEFAPISSSGHLVLVPWLLGPITRGSGWIDDPGQGFDAALHIGTALALIGYFWKQWRLLIAAWFEGLTGKRGRDDREYRLAWMIIIATIPGALFGKLLEHRFEVLFDVDKNTWAPAAIGALLAAAGIALWIADRRKHERKSTDINVRDAIVIGLSQVLALFPGVSRSGATITAGLGMGLSRTAAARFSFLLATPITLGAGLLKLAGMRHDPDHPQAAALVAGIVTSAVVGYSVIRWLMHYLQRQNLNVFVLYRVIFGVLVIAIWWARR